MKNWPETVGWNSDINEVIRTVLNFLFIYFFLFSMHQEPPKSTKKHQKAPKGQKAQKCYQAKT